MFQTITNNTHESKSKFGENFKMSESSNRISSDDEKKKETKKKPRYAAALFAYQAVYSHPSNKLNKKTIINFFCFNPFINPLRFSKGFIFCFS